MSTPIVSTQDGPRLMAGLNNLGGKKAAPYGAKRRKAKRALARAKGSDLSNVDLAFRFKHGWIPLNPSAKEDTRGLSTVMANNRKQHMEDLESTVTKPTTAEEYHGKVRKSMGDTYDDDAFRESLGRLRSRGLIATHEVHGKPVNSFAGRGEKDPYGHLDAEATAKLAQPPGKRQTTEPGDDMTDQEIADWDEHKRQVMNKSTLDRLHRDEKHPLRHLTDYAKEVLNTAQEIDLAFRFKHGWIKLHPDTDTGESPYAQLRKTEERYKADGVKAAASPYARMRALQEGWAGEHTTGKLGTQSEFDRGAAAARARKVARGETGAEAMAKVAADMDARSPEKVAERAYYKATQKHGKQSKQAAKALKAWHDAIQSRRNSPTTKQADAEMRARPAGPGRAAHHGIALSNEITDLARHKPYRYRHGWIPLHPGVDGKPTVGSHAASVRAHNAVKRAKSRLPKWDNLGGNTRGRLITGESAYFSNPSASDVDLALQRQFTRPKRPVNRSFVRPKKPVVRAGEVHAVARVAAARGVSTQAVLVHRASQPGHFRAKAILAAQSGNMRLAKKYEAHRIAAKVARATSAPRAHFTAATPPTKPHFTAAPKPPKPTFTAGPKPAMAPRPPRYKKPKVVR